MLVLAAALSPARAAIAQDDPVARALIAGRTTIRLGAGGPAGDGLDFLRREIARSQHVLVGEPHGSAETPVLVGWILDLAKEAGYSTFFVETGPVSQEIANAILSGPNGMDDFTAFMDAHEMGIAFLNWADEAGLVADALADGWSVVGLDQEFVASGRHLLDRLLALAPDEAARALAQGPVEAERRAVDEFRRTHDQRALTGVFLGSASRDAFDALEAAYAGAGPEAKRILREMRESAEIYRLWSSGRNYESNLARVEMIKRHAREHVDARLGGDWKRLRSVSKFGGGHCARGLNSNSQYDVGTYLSQISEAVGSRSFHLLVVAPASATSHAQSATPDPELRPLYDARADADWTVIDLRPLRVLVHDDGAVESRDLRDVIFSFDAVAIAPALTAASEILPR